jgi:amino acid adenylation domain-containing protein
VAFLPESLAGALKDVGRLENATLFMTLLAAFQTLLYRYTGQVDLVVGSPVAGRNRVELEGLIGLFVNTLPLRTDLSGEPTFRELLGRVRESVLEAFAHQDLPFAKLVEELQPERVPGRTPVFQVLFALQNTPASERRLTDLTMHSLKYETNSAKFDLSLIVAERSDGLRVSFNYSTDLFDAATIERMAGHFRRLLEGIARDAGQGIDGLPLLSEAERHRILVDWNATDAEYPRDASIARLFERQVVRTPHSTAIDFDGRSLTYDQLNRRANRLSHFLRRQGVGPEVCVGLCVERSLEMVVAMVAILKAGGAYVPLDPEYPYERLAFMWEDSAVPVLLTEDRLRDGLPDYPGRLYCLDADEGLWAGESELNPPCKAGGENLAYVIYTSGSTGQPKGVCVTHRAVTRLVFNTNYLQLTDADVVAQASNASFDAATFELWGALLCGARLVGIPKEVLLSHRALATELERAGISAMFLTTALFNEMAREEPAAFRYLSGLLFGGEVADPGSVRAVLQAGGPARLINVYGPTETTTFASWHLVEDAVEGANSIPIGRPLANTRLYVLDAHGEPLPTGVAGELYIGGDGVARGYLGRPELTAERFVPDPFARESGARMYRTGDLARWRPDGVLEYLGRVDDQVKIRGFRIEPGEIEAKLALHPQVRQAVVLVREDKPQPKRLVAYVVARDLQPSAAELRRWLGRTLPDYMIPAAFVTMSELPLTPNGKVDRRALPAPRESEADKSKHIAPSTLVEEVLAGIWADVLGVGRVGVEDNFFELGGHSLRAMQVITRVRQLIGVDLTIRSFLKAPTVAAMAAALEQEL